MMGTTSIYLVPKTSKISAAEYGEKAKKVLLEMGVVVEYRADELRQFGNGNKSASAFEGEDEGDYPFDYGLIFSGPHFTLIPDEFADGVLCPGCGADVTREWCAARLDENDDLRSDDLRGERVSCPKCKGVFRLEELRAEADTAKFYMTDRYVCFVDSQLPKEEWVKEFDKRTGEEHEVVAYWWS